MSAEAVLRESLALPGIGGDADVWRERRELTLELADEFLRACQSQGVRFEAMGVAQGWSPQSYAQSVETLVQSSEAFYGRNLGD